MMTPTLIPPVSGPHTHRKSSVMRTMGLVMAALAPATLFGLHNFGWPALFLFLTTLSAAVGTEAVCLYMAGKRIRPFVTDGSALLTGWLLAVSLPPWAPWWIGALGGSMAVLVGKQVFGGLGQNVFNPAMVGRVILLIAFPLEMTRYTLPSPLIGDGIGFMDGLKITFLGQTDMVDAVASASLLGHIKTETGRGIDLGTVMHDASGLVDMAAGTLPGSLGETSALLLFAGGVFLIAMKVITWHIPVGMLAALTVLATLFNLIDPDVYPAAHIHLLGGATLLGAFFIATDPVTAPVTNPGRLIFGIGLGVMVYVIRTWAAYPEGMAFAVLLMNAAAPLIDRYVRPRIYGRDRKGAPLAYDEDQLGSLKK